jgi:hypothetical protein
MVQISCLQGSNSQCNCRPESPVAFAENLETIEQLWQERSLLTTDHKKLQCRFSEISEVGSFLVTTCSRDVKTKLISTYRKLTRHKDEADMSMRHEKVYE